jgi:hypothetical protein
MAFAKFAERRAYERSKVAVAGRLLLADRRESACTIVDASRNGIAVLTQGRGTVGDPVVLYADKVGRLQGEVVRLFDGGFAFKLTGSSRAADVLLERFGATMANSA